VIISVFLWNPIFVFLHDMLYYSSMRTYNEVIQELRGMGLKPLDDGKIYSGGDFFDYDGTPMEDLFGDFFSFGQEYLDAEDHPFNIRPARMYFSTYSSMNAAARPRLGFNLVEVFMGSIDFLRRLFIEKEQLFKLDDFMKGYGGLTEERGIEPGMLLFQFITIYIFYHEVGHLIQQTEKKKLKNAGKLEEPDDNYIEFLDDDVKAARSKDRHMLELDADWFAATGMAPHIIKFSKETFKKGVIDCQELEDVASLMLSAIYSYQVTRMNRYKKIYYQEHDHPHPSVRVAYLVKFILDQCSLTLKEEDVIIAFDERRVLENAIKISEVLLKEASENVVEKYSLEMYERLRDIEKYINAIIGDVNDCSFSCMNFYKNLKAPSA